MRHTSTWFVSFASAVLVVTPGAAATLTVGPSKTYAAPCAAFAAANDGDRIEIESSGSYAGDVCAVTKNNLTISGMGAARARIDAAGKSAQGKAIWVVQGHDTTIESIEFSGATVPDANGAGIRQEGKNLTVRNCVFRDNQNGILAGDVAGSEILIEFSEFDHNGAGDGYSHNLYINHVARLTFRYNYSHRAAIGHLLKSRAAENYILYNRLTGEADGSQSYEIDCPNGGKTYVIGNVVEQGSLTDNPSMLSYLAEGTHAYNPSSELFVINNSFVNHLGKGTFINIGASSAVPAVIQNNIFYGGGSVCSQSSAISSNNLEGGASCFVDDAAYDYHLQPGSPCVDAGAALGVSSGYSLVPTDQYRHPALGVARPTIGTIDLGAFEYGANTSGGAGLPTGTNAGGTNAGGTNAGGTNAGGINAGGINAGGINAGGINAGGRSGGALTSISGTASSVAEGSRTSDEGCGCRLATPRNRGAIFSWIGGALFACIGFRRRATHRTRCRVSS